MIKKIQQAYGNYYFDNPQLPIKVAVVNASARPQHPYDFTTTSHYHDFSELVVITSGSGMQLIDEVEYFVSAGDVFLMQGNTVHHFPDRNAISMTNILFDPVRLPLPEAFFRKIPGYNVIFQLEPALRDYKGGEKRLKLDKTALAKAEDIIGRLRKELADGTPGYEAAAISLLCELIVFISRHYSDFPPPNHAALLRMGEVISQIERHYDSVLTLEMLAATAKTSPNNLLRLFRTATGDSPINYLLKVRLRHAAELLRTSDFPISEISWRCGFNDSNYFSKKFQALYHRSPRDYRRN